MERVPEKRERENKCIKSFTILEHQNRNNYAWGENKDAFQCSFLHFVCSFALKAAVINANLSVQVP